MRAPARGPVARELFTDGEGVAENEEMSRKSKSFESGLDLWSTCENLAAVSEDEVGEHAEESIDVVEWAGGLTSAMRLNSEGEECEEETGRIREENLFLVGAQYGDQYCESLVKGTEDNCLYCQVRC